MRGSNKTAGEAADALAVFNRALDNLVINVGDIAHIGHVETKMPQIPHHGIEHHHDPRMTDVTIVIDRHTTHIEPDLAGYDRGECLFLAGKAVIDLQHA